MRSPDQRDHYARRAAGARDLALRETDAATRAALIELAASYDTLVAEADRIAGIRERMAQGNGPPGNG